MAYADITLRDPNPIKRWLQRRRFADAVRLLSSGNDRNDLRILDFGAGDGEVRVGNGRRHAKAAMSALCQPTVTWWPTSKPPRPA